MAKTVFNPPPNWPVKKGFTPPAGWQPDPSWGPAPEGWPLWTEKKSHTVRNVILVILGVVILAFAGCTALLVGGVNEVANQQEAEAEANAETCEGITYADQQPDNDRCADESNSVTLDGVVVTASALERDAEGNICTDVSYTNNSDETIQFNMLDWKIQSPAGEVQDNLFAGGGTLSSGDLIAGGEKSGSVCFDPLEGSGEFVLIYKPGAWSDDRGIWVNNLS